MTSVLKNRSFAITSYLILLCGCGLQEVFCQTTNANATQAIPLNSNSTLGIPKNDTQKEDPSPTSVVNLSETGTQSLFNASQLHLINQTDAENQKFLLASELLRKNGVIDIIQVLSNSVIRGFARRYISSRIKKVAVDPNEGKTAYRSLVKTPAAVVRQPLLGTVPLVPEGFPTPKWVPGQLIASQLTRRQLQQINDSVYGPLKSATMYPSVMSTILVFNKPYDPVKLSDVLKANFGVEAEPNGIIN